MPIRTRRNRLAGAAALVAASALALAGCGDSSADTKADERPAAATAAPSSSSPAPEAPPTPTPTSTPSPTPTPTAVTLADFTGRSVGSAVIAAKKAGLDLTVRLQGTGRQASSWGTGEKVCEQSGGPGTVTFTVARDGHDCAGRPLYTPKPTPTPEPARTRDAGGSGGGTGTGGTGDTGSTGTGACELTSPAGNCYADGQFCAKKHRGLSTHGRGGEYLTCSQDSGGRWRWSDGAAG
ncbi:hypothetical protein [Streptomyces sp. JHA26]|uniref:PASTA domain-containing protein n=1 Tax=Streptomyces sp. JHA26 TaxID=1917143 RepID=UPI00098A8E52|nr:hypothetical protein [Streptomyces sp. JHA26]